MEIKQTAFRIDGILAPHEDSDDPWLFLEVQFQPDDSLYPQLFAEIFPTCPACDGGRARTYFYVYRAWHNFVIIGKKILRH